MVEFRHPELRIGDSDGFAFGSCSVRNQPKPSSGLCRALIPGTVTKPVYHGRADAARHLGGR